ncbi:hypothetical protein NPIL_231191 [Nephila pilipes]|uniref:Reverse transcriptase n=1 Tax=Nephila pilipes TaxID=299642 RepID=A0A8X6PIR7_NEPPI|nr:hypothetical protein NPIL_231191 [Nephila pilipes]
MGNRFVRICGDLLLWQALEGRFQKFPPLAYQRSGGELTAGESMRVVAISISSLINPMSVNFPQSVHQVCKGRILANCPQGSVLSPCLDNLCIFEFPHTTYSILFADDAIILIQFQT